VSNPSQDTFAGFGKSLQSSSFDRPLFGVLAAALTVASVITVTPTAASAFSIEGAIAGAIASRLAGGGYHRSYSGGGGRSAHHSSPSHSYAKQDSGSGSSKSGDEKDARDEDAGNAQPISKTTTVRPQPGGAIREASQSVQNDAPAKVQDDELTFKPSR
jgi:hypothetical protein